MSVYGTDFQLLHCTKSRRDPETADMTDGLSGLNWGAHDGFCVCQRRRFAANMADNSRATTRRLPQPSTDAARTAQAPLQNATQIPPIASLSVASAALQNRQRTWRTTH